MTSVLCKPTNTSNNQRSYSFVAGLPVPKQFVIKSSSNNRDSTDSPMMREVDMSPDDEIILTELAFDHKGLITYEISSVILLAEREQDNPYGQFRCYMDSATKEFFIEIPNEKTMAAFSQSALLNVLGLAEEAGVETVYICLRKNINKKEVYLKNFMFLGFVKLTEKEQKQISMTRTHDILKCSLNFD